MNGPVNGSDASAVPEAPREEEPVLEIIIPSALAAVREPAYHFKVWADGRIEGFEKLEGRARHATVVNRFPVMLRELFTPVFEYSDDVRQAINALDPKGAQG